MIMKLATTLVELCDSRWAIESTPNKKEGDLKNENKRIPHTPELHHCAHMTAVLSQNPSSADTFSHEEGELDDGSSPAAATSTAITASTTRVHTSTRLPPHMSSPLLWACPRWFDDVLLASASATSASVGFKSFQLLRPFLAGSQFGGRGDLFSNRLKRCGPADPNREIGFVTRPI